MSLDTVRLRPASPASRPRRLTTAALGTVASGGAVLAVAVFDPNVPGHFPGCPSLALTDLWCPFCGGLRGAHALLHGDLATAVARNPLIPLFAAFAAWVWWSHVRSAWAGRKWSGVGPRATNLALALLVVFTVLRNLPGWDWLSPR